MKMKSLSALVIITLFLLLATVPLKAQIKSVSINGQEWTTENLNVITFRNGDTIPEARTEKVW